MRTFPITIWALILLLTTVSAQAQAPTTQPTGLGVARAEELRKLVNSFMFSVIYVGDDYRVCHSLVLSVPALPTVLRSTTDVGMEAANISQAQAGKLIDYLLAQGLLDRADRLTAGPIPGITDVHPQYILSLSGTYWESLGWGPPMLQRLDSLRRVMDGEAAKKMDLLLSHLAGQREAWQKQAATQPAATPIAFDTYSGYFVSNKFEPDAPASFVVIADQKTFDTIFGIAAVMGDQSHRLPADAFESKIVVAVIKRGKAVTQFTVEHVAQHDAILTVHYSTRQTPSDSADFACPLIISVSKGTYTAAQFVEDAKTVKKIDLKPAPSAP
jgi:hypothetical protein